jgi:predicted SAM-dependent methyltransferase
MKKILHDVKRVADHIEKLFIRSYTSAKFIKRTGIEIGALHKPLRTWGSTKVKYVDRMSVPDLRQQYPELRSKKLVHVDIIDDAEYLRNIENSSQNFVIANHFIEHCQNPIGTIMNMFRVLRPEGILYLSIPEKRYTFDRNRPVTTLEHLYRDYFEGPEWSYKEHFEEWVKIVNNIQDDDEAEKIISNLMNVDYSIHFHVWTKEAFLEFLINLKKMQKFNIEFFKKAGKEVVCVIRKATQYSGHF